MDVNASLMWNIGYELCIEASVLLGHGAPFTALQIADSTAAKIAEKMLLQCFP